MKIGNGDISADVPQNLKPGLDGELGFGWKEGIVSFAAGERCGGIHDDLGIGGSRDVGVASDVDGVDRSP
jgi:hypothetical protein